ncbi:Smr/MutS family protein [Thioalkalivibrio sp. AKL19]|uniref:Smr/MutS family protein n=1 Tax=Thioalkalivibrio sp. AKL19 TaxID=1266914 RepID=UPI0003FF4E70|nr:Smr/MutS family protein [Thioalkalivibrio sp. AKL19]
MNSGDDPNDFEEFLQAIGNVRRLHSDRAEVRPPRPAPRARQRDADEARAHADWLSDPLNAADLQPGDELRFARPGISQRVFRKLRGGHYRIQDEIDLHGLFADEARRAIGLFLDDARHNGALCVRIVHGKGLRSRQKGPVLKGLTDHWLRQRDDVLAFSSARPADGGTGAVYVLLKRPRKSDPVR